jgi:hypothetical protein
MPRPSNFFPSTTPQLLCLRDSTRNPFLFIDLTGIPQPRPPIDSFIQALRIAARNAKNVRFDDVHYRASEQPRVREVPDYARQYLIEQPEFGPIEPNQARVAQAPSPAKPQKP